MSETNPLEFVTTQEIFDELLRRNQAVVLATVKDSTDSQTDFFLFYGGGITHCIGICDRAKHLLIDDCRRAAKPKHDDTPE